MPTGITGLAQTAVAALATTSEPALESKFHQPWSEPVRQRIAPQLAVALIASGLASVAAAPFAETVTQDRWHQPWSEPVRTRWFPPAEQQAVAPDPATRVSFSWWAWLSEPVVKARPRLPEAHQQWLAFAPPFSAGAVQSEWSGPPPSLVRFQYQVQTRPPWPDINVSWLPPLSEPVRIRPGLLAALQPYEVSYDVLPLPFLAGGGGWYLPDPTRPPSSGEASRTTLDDASLAIRKPRKPGAPREVAPKIEPPSFAEVIGSQQPARLADVLGSVFAPQLAEFAPPALDLWFPPRPAAAASAVPASARELDAAADHVDAMDAMEAMHALDELERQEHEALIAILLHLASSE